MNYLFHFGHTPHLARLELASYLSRNKIKFKKTVVSPGILIISSKNKIDPDHAINTLGGTIRIATQIGRCKSEQISTTIAGILKGKTSKPTFSLTPINSKLNTRDVSKKIKDLLKQQNLTSRFLLTEEKFLPPIQIKSQKVFEFTLVNSDHTVSIFQTQVVTDYQDWVKRDRLRPQTDPRSGMIPPKVARMMLNLSLTKPITPSTTILDPFCGSGTILSEALVLGINSLGSDINPKAVQDSRENLSWIKTNYPSPAAHQVIQADATELTPENFNSTHIDSIVAEGFLGPPQIKSAPHLYQVLNDLEALYSQVLPNLAKLLPSGGKLVIALPKYNSPESVKMLSNLIDTCENNQYTRLLGPINYSKPGAKVKRAIYVLKKS